MITGTYFIKLNSGGWIRFPRNWRYDILTGWLPNHFGLGRYKTEDEGLFRLFPWQEEYSQKYDLHEVFDYLIDSDNLEIRPNKEEAIELISRGFNTKNPPPVRLRIPIEIRRAYHLKPGEELVVLGLQDSIEVWRKVDYEKCFNT